MIEKLVNSKTRLKILKLFLSHIDDRYYLRELERLLEESLSPLRRQLLKLTVMGILIAEEEANLKYYRLNKNFEGLEELKRMVLGEEVLGNISAEIASAHQGNIGGPRNDSGEDAFARNNNYETTSLARSVAPKQFRYDLVFLSFISIFVLITAIYVGYANMKNVKQVVKLIEGEPLPPPRSPTATSEVLRAGNGEMISKKWKVIPGNIPVLSSIEASEDKKSEEL